jgi:integrase
MSTKRDGKQEMSELRTLPRVSEPPVEVLTPDNQVVDTSSSVWEVKLRAESQTTIILNINNIDPNQETISDRCLMQMRLYLAERLTQRKASTVRCDLEAFRQFVKWWKGSRVDQLHWAVVEEEDFRGFLQYCLETPNAGNDFARIRSFYSWGAYKRSFPDFSKDLASVLRTIRASGNEKGRAVRTLDPREGPLDDTEVKCILDALESGLGTIEQRITVRLLIELGVRNSVLTILRRKDFLVYEYEVVEEGGLPNTRRDFHLKVPILKKRKPILERREMSISRNLGEELNSVIPEGDDDFLLPWLAGLRDPRQRIRQDVKQWAEAAELKSHRTGEPLHLTPRRFRYTLATSMAAEGASPAQIANALGHSDLQNVSVYVDASSKMIDRMYEDGAFDFYDDVVQLFKGTVEEKGIGSDSEQSIPGSSAHVPGMTNEIGAIGSCGKGAPCSLAPPLSCYTCPKFIARREARHDQVAAALEESIRNADERSDQRIPQQLVTTLQAVNQLQRQLDEER